MQFFFIAYGSDCEFETRDMISADLDYLKEERLQRLRREIGDVGAMFKAMIKSLERKPLNPWPRPINFTVSSINCQHCEAWPIS